MGQKGSYRHRDPGPPRVRRGGPGGGGAERVKGTGCVQGDVRLLLHPGAEEKND